MEHGTRRLGDGDPTPTVLGFPIRGPSDSVRGGMELAAGVGTRAPGAAAATWAARGTSEGTPPFAEWDPSAMEAWAATAAEVAITGAVEVTGVGEAAITGAVEVTGEVIVEARIAELHEPLEPSFDCRVSHATWACAARTRSLATNSFTKNAPRRSTSPTRAPTQPTARRRAATTK